ncbi:MAG: hypothetical protein CMJ78_07660 [Planctomycetaceae bacterium]|nr:hypothetical protein [Planctomycetaceae bacterium]
MNQQTPKENDASESGQSASVRQIKAEELFGPHNQVLIEHRGEIYTLRITKNDKLILNK